MRLAYPTWVEAGYACPTDRVEVGRLSLLGRLAADPAHTVTATAAAQPTVRTRALVAAGGAPGAVVAGHVLAISTGQNTRHRGRKPSTCSSGVRREADAHMLTCCRRGGGCRGGCVGTASRVILGLFLLYY
jgi:hypothetical protein